MGFLRNVVLVALAIVTLLLCHPPLAQGFTQHVSVMEPRFATRHVASHRVVTVDLVKNGDELSSRDEFFIRKVLPADLGTASRILADGFFGDRNFIVYEWEKLRTYLSLDSDFPKTRDQHEMFVVCKSTDGTVVAVCDIDNRPNLKERPYMCNLAVSKKHRNQGLAKALVMKCEEQVLKWNETELHLKARQVNKEAVGLYKSLGYEICSEAFDTIYMDHLVVMKKKLAEAIEVD